MKNKIISLIVVMLLLTLMVGVTYSFFNYTRTGSENRVSVGRISFTSSQDNTINLTNVFPARSDNLNDSNSDTVTVNITGDTTYTGGIEYKVTIEDINNTINDKEIPLSFKLTTSNLGEKSNEYWSDRGSTANVYNLVENGVAEEGKYILVGYIKPDSVGVNGSIDITAYIDTDKIAISDTYSRIENDELIIGETTSEWADGRVVLTTEEWNSFTNSPISFKLKVEANEGTWVEEEKSYVLTNLNGITEWTDIRANITSIEFHKDGIVPENPIHTIDATDITSEGPVTVYTVDDGLGNNTYKAIVVANDTIYAPESCYRMFSYMSNLITFNSINFKVESTTDIRQIFFNNLNLKNIDSLSTWNTYNILSMQSAFANCSNLSSIEALSNWNVDKVEVMMSMFNGCTNLIDISGLSNWNVGKVTNMAGMFYCCKNLENVDSLANWNTSNVINMSFMFSGCKKLTNVNGLINWNVSKVETMQQMFRSCINLEEINLQNWKTSPLENMSNMFGMWDDNGQALLTSKLKRIILSNKFDTSKVTDMYGLFANNTLIEDYSFLIYLNTENVENMQHMFLYNYGLINLNNLSTWNVGKAMSMVAMFGFCSNLQDASAINNWDINADIDFTNMFKNTTVHPIFTKVSGTWDSEGSFTPNI